MATHRREYTVIIEYDDKADELPYTVRAVNSREVATIGLNTPEDAAAIATHYLVMNLFLISSKVNQELSMSGRIKPISIHQLNETDEGDTIQ